MGQKQHAIPSLKQDFINSLKNKDENRALMRLNNQINSLNSQKVSNREDSLNQKCAEASVPGVTKALPDILDFQNHSQMQPPPQQRQAITDSSQLQPNQQRNQHPNMLVFPRDVKPLLRKM